MKMKYRVVIHRGTGRMCQKVGYVQADSYWEAQALAHNLHPRPDDWNTVEVYAGILGWIDADHVRITIDYLNAAADDMRSDRLKAVD